MGRNLRLCAYLSLLVCLVPGAFSQEMSRQEKSRTCSNQIINSLILDKVIGGDTGICIDYKYDPQTGDLTSFKFSMTSDAFDLGKSELRPETKERLEKIKRFVLGYQQEILNHKNGGKSSKILTPDDLNFSVQSFADGVRGTSSVDSDIQKHQTWGELFRAISKDSKSLNTVRDMVAGLNINSNRPVDFNELDRRKPGLGRDVKSIFRNVFLGQNRSKSICRSMGVSKCSNRDILGFASPELEKNHTPCAARRVSVVSFNLSSQSEANQSTETEFHPRFKIGNDMFRGRALQYDMQIASAMEIIKRQKQGLPLLPENCGVKTDRDGKRVSEDYMRSVYQKLLNNFMRKYQKFKNTVGADHPLLQNFENAEFAAYRDAPVDKNFEGALATLMDFQNDAEDVAFTTDYFNCFPSGKAMQYFMKHSNSNPYTSVPGPNMMLGSNDPTIKYIKMGLNQSEVPTVKGSKGWMCEYCHKGIAQEHDGHFTTNYRTQGLFGKKTEENAALHASSPTSFGSLKSPTVYVVKNCFNCNCLSGEKDLDEVLRTQAERITVSELPWRPAHIVKKTDLGDGSMSSDKGICIFTPPIAHACQFRPAGVAEAQNRSSNRESFSCMYMKTSFDKDTHEKTRQLQWTMNFAQDVLAMTPNEATVGCQRVQTLDERVKSVRCKKDQIPSSNTLPKSCQEAAGLIPPKKPL